MLDVLRAWYSDDNIVFRTRLERAQLHNFAEKFSLIIEQGNQEGLFSAQHPLAIAQIILAIMQDVSHRLLDVIVNPNSPTDHLSNIFLQINIYQASIEQLLGAPSGSINIFNTERLKQWL